MLRFPSLLPLVLAICCATGLARPALADTAEAKWGRCHEANFSCSALLIGNRKYDHHEPIEPALRDAKGVRDTLRDVWGYQHLEVEENLDAKQLRTAWQKFRTQLKARGGGVALFYFSGHGYEYRKDNLLLPVDMPGRPDHGTLLNDSFSLETLYRDFDKLQKEIKQETGETLHGIFIIDACRSSIPEKQPKTKNYARVGGVSPVVPPPGLFALYAASSREEALSQLPGESGDALSVFTRMLLPIMEQNVPLIHMAHAVRWRVFKTVNERRSEGVSSQTPDYFDRLTNIQLTLGGQDWKQVKHRKSLELKPAEIRNLPREGGGTKIWERHDFPTLVLVPGIGDTSIGVDGTDIDDDDIGERELPRFAIGTNEVTTAEYHTFAVNCDQKSGECPTNVERWRSASDDDIGKQPVTGVSWHDAQKYTAWLNKAAGLARPTSDTKDADIEGLGYYRLPWEVEWEYAARGRTGPNEQQEQTTPPGQEAQSAQKAQQPNKDVEIAYSRYLFGNATAPKELAALCEFGNGADASLNSIAWTNGYCNDGFARGVAPVRSFKQNAFGVYDVHGNVWELVGGCWTEARQKLLALPRDTKLCPSGRRVARGGSWRSGPDSMTLSSRISFGENHRRPTLGFRVLRVVGQCEFADGGTCPDKN